MAANRNRVAGIHYVIFMYFYCMSKTCDDNRPTLIYTLSDPITGRVRYVGKTVQTLQYRLTQHIWDSSNRVGHTHKWCWIKSITRKGSSPIIEELEECLWPESALKEMYWISQMKTWGFNLVNETDGGEGNSGGIRSIESIKKMKDTLLKKAKPVYQYSLDGGFVKKWLAAKIASKETGVAYANIVQCCVKEKKSAGGYMWRYKHTKRVAPWRSNKRRIKSYQNNVFYQKRKKIAVTDSPTGKTRVFSSINTASIATGIGKAGICEECQGKRKTRGNFIFKYYEQSK